ncbi:MAG: Do family serine endopeptidase [Bacteroidota bacterium]
METKKILTFILIAFTGGLFAVTTSNLVSKTVAVNKTQAVEEPEENYQPAAGSASSDPVPQNLDFTKAAELSVHAVVHIKTEYQQKSSVYDDFYGGSWDPWGFFSNPQYKDYSTPAKVSGSGVILTSDGYIVTNNHVVQDASYIEITLNDNRTYEAKIIGKDAGTDLALVKIDEKDLPYLSYGNSDSVKVGEWVLAVGNPFNLTSTVTAGIISAKARNLNILGKNSSIESFLQTDAAVNPGNSGGALVNTDGELIGVNAAIASNTGSYLGYSFAIPVNIVKKVVEDFISYGQVQRAYLGITYEEIDSKVAKEKGLSKVKGILISTVAEKGAAAEAGLQEGDIITKIGSSAVNSSSELQEAIVIHRPGDEVKVSYIRDNVEKEDTVTLKNIDNTTDVVKNDETSETTLFGATFETPTADELKDLGIESGVKISKLDAGLLKNAGIREGFIITKVDKKQIISSDDLKTVLKDKKGEVLIEGIYANGMHAYYGFGM